MYDVIIIGGGLAGSSAAVQLARHNWNVLLLEKRQLPAPKLCGEFLSPESQGAFRRLDVLEAVKAAGACPVERARVTTGKERFEGPLPGAGLGLSRYRLDDILLKHARQAGAEARDGMSVRTVSGSLAEGFAVETADGAHFEGRVVLGAYGKRSLLDRKLERSFMNEPAPLVAFKTHYVGGELPEDAIEVHAFPGGYCGLSHVEANRVNCCWIAREHLLKEADGDADVMIEQSLGENPLLADRLRAMERTEEPFLAISQISLSSKSTFEQDVCMIGDAAGMIAPLCGDGMAMALRSAELAVPWAEAFLKGSLSPGTFRRQYDSAWRAAFALRMRLGRWIHRGSLRPMVASAVVRACRLAPPAGRWLIRHTRG